MGPNQTTYTELRTRYNSVWTPPPTEFPNEPTVAKTGIWARFTITDGNEKQIDIGDGLKTFRVWSVLTIQFFAPPETGSIDVLEKAEQIAALFRNYWGTSLSCREVTVKNIGNDPLGWYQVNVDVLYKVDTLQ